MAHLTTAERMAAAADHAERAHALLTDAEAAWASAGAGKVGEREALRIELAEAHAACSTALSSLVLPAAAAAPAPPPR